MQKSNNDSAKSFNLELNVYYNVLYSLLLYFPLMLHQSMDEASDDNDQNVKETHNFSMNDFSEDGDAAQVEMTVSHENVVNKDTEPSSPFSNSEQELVNNHPFVSSLIVQEAIQNCAKNIQMINSSNTCSENYENSRKNFIPPVKNRGTPVEISNKEYKEDKCTYIDSTANISVKQSKSVQDINSQDVALNSDKFNLDADEKLSCDEIEVLKQKVTSLENETLELKAKLYAQENAFKNSESQLRAEFLSSVEKLSKECNVLRKEKEAIVIRYANSEKEVIKEKKVQQELEKKLKDMNKDRENLITKLKNALAENAKLSSSVENKMVEIVKLQKENEKLTADFNSREIRIKWLQNKLKIEMNSHKDTQVKLEHTMHRLNEMREEAEQVRKDCQEMIKCYQEAEEIKSVKLDSELKQKLTELEVHKQEKTDQEQVYHLLRQELDALKRKQRMTMDDNNSLTLKINSLEKDRLEYEQTLSKLKDSQNLLKQEVVDLTARLAEMEDIKLQLEREREKSAASLREVERLRLTNAELQADMDACHVKEGELLEFTEKITAKTVHLQSDHCLLEVKAQALEDELARVKKNLTELQQKCLQLTTELENARKDREDEVQLLARKLAEKAKNVEKLNIKLDEAENENRVLKRRHIASIKELSRELFHCRRRLDSYESGNHIPNESSSLGSRASSTASLDMLSTNENRTCFNSMSPTLSFSGSKGIDNSQSKHSVVDISAKLDKEMLIERIIKLQTLLARKNDKIDFLEDHIQQLVKEMRKKSKSVDFKAV